MSLILRACLAAAVLLSAVGCAPEPVAVPAASSRTSPDVSATSGDPDPLDAETDSGAMSSASARVSETSAQQPTSTVSSPTNDPVSTVTTPVVTATPSAPTRSEPRASPSQTPEEEPTVAPPGPALLQVGDTGDQTKDLQARLQQIGWFNTSVTGTYGPVTTAAVEGFQAKRALPVTGEVDQTTLDRLYAMTRTPTTEELTNASAAPPAALTLDDRCLKGRAVCISKAQRTLAWVVDGTVRLTMDVRFGSELTPTRNGAFSVNWKSRHHVSTLYDSAMPYALFFSGGQAVHFSADFLARGYNGSSHGCVNVRDEQAVAALFDATREGDKVIVY